MISSNLAFSVLSNWFYKNLIALNLDRYYFMLFEIKDELETDVVSNNITIEYGKEEEIFGNRI